MASAEGSAEPSRGFTSESVVPRRAFLAGAIGLGASVSLRPQQIDSLSGKGVTGSLRDPSVVQARARATARDNDEFIKNVEHRLRCTCGCNLDIYTCRTTDFSCQTSPRLHRQILALQDSGKSAEEILAAFVQEHGEQVLMAPKAEGFNWVGYLLPGAAITVAAACLVVRLARRREAVALASAHPTGEPAGSAAGAEAGAQPQATVEELERLRRALSDVES